MRWRCAGEGAEGGGQWTVVGDQCSVIGSRWLHGDGFVEFEGGADELFHLTSEVAHFPGDFAVVAPEGLQPVEFRLELVNLL